MGYKKQIPRCPEKSINATNGTRILQSRSDRRTDPKSSRHWSRELFAAVATSRSEYFTVKRIMKKLICCLSWSSGEDWSADLCQKFPNSTTRAVRLNEYGRTGGHNYYLWENSKMCKDGADQFHHGKATNRIRSVTSFSGISIRNTSTRWKARITFRLMKLGRYVIVDDGGN